MNKTGCVWALLLGLGLSPGFAGAATLYEWKDASGETRYGYRPPPGVVGTVVGQRAREAGPSKPVDCKQLQEEHIRLIDKEIARLRSLPVGLGPQFEFTAESRQRFVNDLLAHRAAFLTGRSSEEFSPPDSKRQINELKDQYGKDKALLMQDLEAQARQLDRDRRELERQRTENSILYQRTLGQPLLLLPPPPAPPR
jgi:hypothetical protein